MNAGGKPPLSDYEIERGKPVPSFNHAIVQSRLIAEFLCPEDLDVVSEVTLKTPAGSFTPDIAVFKRQPRNWTHDQAEVDKSPLLAVEILTAGQAFDSIVPKLDAYFPHGVGSVWVVQPALQLVTVFQSLTNHTFYSACVVTDPTTGISADLANVFA